MIGSRIIGMKGRRIKEAMRLGRRPLDRKGQARIIEALVVLTILIASQIMLAGYYQSLQYEEPSSLRREAERITEALRNRSVVEAIMSNSTGWETELETLITTLISPGVYFNLTVWSTMNKGQLNRYPITNLEGMILEEFGEYYTIKETYTISIPVQISLKVRIPVDVVLVVDKSGSMDEIMQGKMKITWLKEALTTFLSSNVFSKETDRIGLVSFSDNAWNGTNYGGRYGCPLTNNFDAVKSKVSTLDPQGGTYGGLGLLYATMQLNGSWSQPYRPESVKVIVFLTDGMVNFRPVDERRPWDPTNKNIVYCGHDDDGGTPKYYISSYRSDGYANLKSYDGPNAIYYGGRGYALKVARQAARQGIKIYTIGFGTSETWFDPNFLKKVATERYYYAATGNQLVEIFLEIAEDLATNYYVETDFIVLQVTLARV
jgi:hypothetical protein